MSDFHLLLEEQLPDLMRYAAALTRDPDDAGELVEDTVRDVLAHPPECQSSGDVRLWLLTALHDLRGNPFRAMTTGSPRGRGPARLLGLSDLDRALGTLSEDQRAILLLLGLVGLTYGETAGVLRITVSTLKSRRARALVRVRRALGLETEMPALKAA